MNASHLPQKMDSRGLQPIGSSDELKKQLRIAEILKEVGELADELETLSPMRIFLSKDGNPPQQGPTAHAPVEADLQPDEPLGLSSLEGRTRLEFKLSGKTPKIHFQGKHISKCEYLPKTTVLEILLRVFLGMRETAFNLDMLLDILIELGFPFKHVLDFEDRKKGIRTVRRNVQKLEKVGFLEEIAPRSYDETAVYMLHPNFNPEHPYIRKYLMWHNNPNLFNDPPKERKPKSRRR